MNDSAPVKVWDWPLRLWHWLFAVCIGCLLYTGLSGDLSLLAWHMRFGCAMVGLILFRLLWGIWGGRHARWPGYRVGPKAIVGHFRGGRVDDPHTAPGRAMAVALVLLATAQASTGLFANDAIFTEGPLARYVSGETSNRLTWIHNRVFWGIIACAATHLAAHLVYALRKDRTPLAMFTGRKRVAATAAATDAATRDYWLRALVTGAIAGGIVWIGLAVF